MDTVLVSPREMIALRVDSLSTRRVALLLPDFHVIDHSIAWHGEAQHFLCWMRDAGGTKTADGLAVNAGAQGVASNGDN